ncbi:MAG: BON domain-containing protein [Desulfobacterales bacterium]|nr:BON domain-containing protein [Desulfobacterales bacterium]
MKSKTTQFVKRFSAFCLSAVICMVVGCTSSQSPGPAVYHANTHQEAPRSVITVVDDSLTLAKIKKKIFYDDLVDQDDIDISVRHGVVYLTGTAKDEYHRRMMTDLIRTVDGVTRIENRMNLAHRGTVFQTAESLVVDQIRMNLIRDPDLATLPLAVEATPTRVILSGQVRSEVQKQKAATIAATFAGDRQIINEIKFP